MGGALLFELKFMNLEKVMSLGLSNDVELL
jgi:hypothetical protein